MKIFGFVLLSIALVFPKFLYSQSSDTITYIITFGDRQAGYQKVWKGEDGYWEADHTFNDRGRGPEVHTRYKENQDGYLTFVEASGKNYLKNEVTEKFRFEQGQASWENESEKDTKKLEKLAFYSGINSSGGNLVKALVKSSNKSVEMLPAGKAVLLMHRKFTFTVDGSEKTLYLSQIGGLDLTPQYVWSDENNNEVGVVGEWYSSLLTAYKPLKDRLYAEQKKIEDSYFSQWPTRLTKQSQGIAITNVNLFDSEKAMLLKGMTVVVEKGMITKVGTAKATKVPQGFTSIDGSGKTLMPGMWDMHVHFSGPSDGVLHLGAGVTNVRDMANTTSLVETRDKIDNGEFVGPRIAAMAGFIDGAGPYAGPTGEIVNSPEEGIESVKKYAGLKYPQIKLYSSIRPEWVAPIAAEAKKNNMKVSGHIPAYMTASEAIDAGYDEIQHINMLFLNFYGKDKDTRTPLRFSLVAEKAASFDFESTEFKSFIDKMVKKGIVSDPTLSVFEEMFTSVPGQSNPVYASIIDRLPASVQRSARSFGGLPAEGKEETFTQSFASCLKFVKAMHDAGVTIVAGTDAMPGFAYQRELELYHKAGIPANEVLKIATYNGAKVAGRLNDLGSIKEGKIADMILVNGDPVNDISDIRKVDTVVKGSIIYNTQELYNVISVMQY